MLLRPATKAQSIFGKLRACNQMKSKMSVSIFCLELSLKKLGCGFYEDNLFICYYFFKLLYY